MLYIKSRLLSDENSKDFIQEVPEKTYNSLVKRISADMRLPTKAEADLRRNKKIILQFDEGKVYIEIMKELLPGDKVNPPYVPEKTADGESIS